jgi:hypothetical protein
VTTVKVPTHYEVAPADPQARLEVGSASALLLRDGSGATHSEQPGGVRDPHSNATRGGVGSLCSACPEPSLVSSNSSCLYVVLREPQGRSPFRFQSHPPRRGSGGRCRSSGPMTLRRRATRIDLDGWRGNRRVLMPDQVMLDRRSRVLRHRQRTDAQSPEVPGEIEVVVYGAELPARLSLVGAVVQVRGPWVIPLGDSCGDHARGVRSRQVAHRRLAMTRDAKDLV